ncbi:MAG: hypothetical protein RIT10_1930 [Bacteroidota bacterium]
MGIPKTWGQLMLKNINMKLLVFHFMVIPLFVFGQTSEKLWIDLGVKHDFTKKLSVEAHVTNRFYYKGVQTFFPAVLVKYKIRKWLVPSLEYRGIFSENKYENYDFKNRLNANLELKKEYKRFTFSGRIRYQFSFDKLYETTDYNAEFDQSIRIKPSIKYKIKKSKFTPLVSIEYFYNPKYEENGRQFVKYRFSAGTDFDLDKKNSFSFSYILDQQYNVADPKRQHILSISYTRNLTKKD